MAGEASFGGHLLQAGGSKEPDRVARVDVQANVPFHGRVSRMASNEPVRRVTTPAGDPAWMVTGYDEVKALLADPRLGRSHPEPERAARYTDAAIFGQASGSPSTERSEHTWMRKLLSRSFSARRMAALQPQVQELVDGLLDEMAGKARPVDLHEAVSFPLPALVICALLGVPYEDRDHFRRWSDDAADMTDGARSRAGLARLQQYMRELADSKRQQFADDVISDLVEAQQLAPDLFTDEHVAVLAAGLLFAGHKTTVAALDKGVLLLLTHPAELDALYSDPARVSRVVEEVLRAPNPVDQSRAAQVRGVPRWASADIEVGGVTISAGDLVVLALHSANLDDRVFASPETFDVGRAENSHLMFGHGPHFCLGAPLARIELQTVSSTLFQRFPTLTLAVPVDELRSRSHLLIGALTELPVTW